MPAISHVTERGHRCRNPLKYRRAEYIRAGEVLQLGDWELHWYKGVYIVQHIRQPIGGHWYEFTNFSCAGAKLAELGGYAK